MAIATCPPEALIDAPAVPSTAAAGLAPLALAPAIDRESAARRLLRAAWPLTLRPVELASALRASELRPVLVPAWSLALGLRSTWTCGTARSGGSERRFESFVVPGVEGELAEVVRGALAGPAEPLEIPAHDLNDWSPLGLTRPVDAAWRAACTQLCEVAAEEAAIGLSLEEIDSLTVETRFEEGPARPLLVPAWRARFQVDGREFSLLVEACNGRVVGRFPWHGRRLLAFAAAAGSLFGAAWALLP